MSVPNYNGKNTSVAIFGENVVGLVDVSISPSSDLAAKSVGIKGEIAYSILADKSATISVTIQQNSPTNAFLYGLIEAFDAAGETLPVFAIVVKNSKNPVMPVLENCIVSKRPTLEFKSEQTDTVWEFMAEKYYTVPQTEGSQKYLSAALSGVNAFNSLKDLLDQLL